MKILISAASRHLAITDITVEKIQALLGQSEINSNSQEAPDKQKLNK